VKMNIPVSSWSGRLICIFAVALVVRIVFVLMLQGGFYFPDSIHYSRAAENLIATGEFGETFDRPPAYSLFLAGIYTLFGQKIVAVRLLEAVMGACLAVVIAIMAGRICGEEAGGLAGVLWSIYPLSIFIAGLVYPTGLAALLLAGSMLCMLTKPDQALAPPAVAAAGILLGLSALTISIALATVLTTALWIAYRQRTRRLFLVTLFLGGVALSLMPWMVRNYHRYDRLVIVEPRIVEQLPYIEMTSEDRVGEVYVSPAEKILPGITNEDKVRRILERPRAFAAHFMRQFWNFWELSPSRIWMDDQSFRESRHERDARIVKETVFTTPRTALVSVVTVGPMFFFALIGTGAMWIQKEQRPYLFLLCGTVLSFAVGYSCFTGKLRYRIPVEPYIIILSAYGLTQIWHALARAISRIDWSKAETSQLSVD
jgi:4-amino-4-deoxy-L-arabinose transferase-like glycosyltransferase